MFACDTLLLLLSCFNCVWLCDPTDSSPPGSPIPGILQARTLEWAAISFSSAWKWKVKGKSLSRVWLFATSWTAAHQAPPSMGFSRQEYWSGVLDHAKKNSVSVILAIDAVKRTFGGEKKKYCPLKLASDTDFLNFTACLRRQKTVRSGTSYLPESI